MKAIDSKPRVSLANILFATDCSATADAALPYALAFAKRYGSKIHAVHVASLLVPPLTAMPPVAAWPDLQQALDAQAQEKTATLDAQLAGVPHEIVIREGDPWEEIAKVIEEHQIDLLVIGTHGRSGVGKALLGSVAETIFRKSPRPVLTVGPHVSGEAEKTLATPEIVLAMDFSSESRAAIPLAVSLAQERGARLTLLHVLPRTEIEDVIAEVQYVEATVGQLRELVPADAELACEPSFLVERGIASERILETARERAAALIVLGVRRPLIPVGVETHLAGGTAYKVVVNATCPVLTVRG